jgi:2-dehydro-3-deoxygluconokinase
MGKFITFGEIMLRLTSVGHERYLQAKSFSACYAGSEANVAVSLAALGRESYFVTKLPVHEIGQAALNELRRFGVRTELGGGSPHGRGRIRPGPEMRDRRPGAGRGS